MRVEITGGDVRRRLSRRTYYTQAGTGLQSANPVPNSSDPFPGSKDYTIHSETYVPSMSLHEINSMLVSDWKA